MLGRIYSYGQHAGDYRPKCYEPGSQGAWVEVRQRNYAHVGLRNN